MIKLFRMIKKFFSKIIIIKARKVRVEDILKMDGGKIVSDIIRRVEREKEIKENDSWSDYDAWNNWDKV
ncbi:MAG: hypothetical protein AAB366_01025 [Patescibacteria group bacterium]